MAGPVHTVVWNGRAITATWFDAPFSPWRSRVYGLYFTPEEQLVLVRSTQEPGWYVPGGGVEVGESPEEALCRELREEIAATISAHEYLGCQRIDDAEDPAGPHSDFHLYYWCRVLLDPFVPNAEVAERRLIGPDVFLETISWADDAAAPIMLERALAAGRRHG